MNDKMNDKYEQYIKERFFFSGSACTDKETGETKEMQHGDKLANGRLEIRDGRPYFVSDYSCCHPIELDHSGEIEDSGEEEYYEDEYEMGKMLPDMEDIGYNEAEKSIIILSL